MTTEESKSYWNWDSTIDDDKASYWYSPGVGHKKVMDSLLSSNSDTYLGWKMAKYSLTKNSNWQKSFAPFARMNNDSATKQVDPEKKLKKAVSEYWNCQEKMVMGKSLNLLSHTQLSMIRGAYNRRLIIEEYNFESEHWGWQNGMNANVHEQLCNAYG